MMEVKVLRTFGTAGELIEKMEGDYIQLFLTSEEESNKVGAHSLGEVLVNTDNEHYFAIIVKDEEGGKIKVAATRVAIIRLFKKLINEMHRELGTIIIDRQQFKNENEVSNFICTMQEMLLVTSYGDEVTENASLVITNCSTIKSNIFDIFPIKRKDKKVSEEK